VRLHCITDAAGVPLGGANLYLSGLFMAARRRPLPLPTPPPTRVVTTGVSGGPTPGATERPIGPASEFRVREPEADPLLGHPLGDEEPTTVRHAVEDTDPTLVERTTEDATVAFPGEAPERRASGEMRGVPESGRLGPYASHVDEIRRLYVEGEVDAALDLAAMVRPWSSGFSLESVPVVAMSPTEILTLPLDARSGFLLARIDGTSTLQTLLDVSAMPASEAMSLLEELLGLGAVRLLPPA